MTSKSSLFHIALDVVESLLPDLSQLHGSGKTSINMSLDRECAPFMKCGDSRSFTRFFGALLDLVEESTNHTQRSASHFVSDLLSFFVDRLRVHVNRPNRPWILDISMAALMGLLRWIHCDNIKFALKRDWARIYHLVRTVLSLFVAAASLTFLLNSTSQAKSWNIHAEGSIERGETVNTSHCESVDPYAAPIA